MSTFKHIKTKERFIERANEKHNNKYDYSLVYFPPRAPGMTHNGKRTRRLPDYNAQAYIKIVCRLHGEFEQQTRKHLEGHGCKYCAQQLITKAFVQSRGVHDYTSANRHEINGEKITLFSTPSDGVERRVLLDKQDLEILKYGNWMTTGHQESRNSRTNYAVSSQNKRMIREGLEWLGTAPKMHRLIMSRLLGRKLFKHEQIDHINADGLDNRRCNLRIATTAQNHANRRKRSTKTTSQYKGVCWNKEKEKWMSYIGSSKKNSIVKRTYLGLYYSEEEAARAYDKKALEVYGEYANLNFSEESETEEK